MKSIAADLLPYESKEFDVGRFKTRYLDEGSGDETLLCVHGNPTWSFYYRRVIESFSATHRVIAVDHLGCGRSDKPARSEAEYSLAAHRDRLVSLIEHLDLQNVTLIAHDWGGAIGLSSLVKTKSRFKRIVLLNTGAFPPPYIPLRIGVCRTPVLGTLAMRGANLFAKAAVTMAMSRNAMSPNVARGLLAPYDNWTNRVAIDTFVRDIPMTKKHPTYETLKQLESDLAGLADLPSLLVWGMKDWCFNAVCLERFESVWPQSTVVKIADAGHYVIEDAPDETLDAIGNFLSLGSDSGPAKPDQSLANHG